MPVAADILPVAQYESLLATMLGCPLSFLLMVMRSVSFYCLLSFSDIQKVSLAHRPVRNIGARLNKPGNVASRKLTINFAFVEFKGHTW